MSGTTILFRWENKLALVDTGIGSVVGEPTGLLEQRLSALGIQPDDIEVVFLTHLHIDHVGGLLDRANKKSRFPRARVFISQTGGSFGSKRKHRYGFETARYATFQTTGLQPRRDQSAKWTHPL